MSSPSPNFNISTDYCVQRKNISLHSFPERKHLLEEKGYIKSRSTLTVWRCEMSSIRMLNEMLREYKASHRQLLEENAEFARWLRDEYMPIAGGWMY